MSDPKVFKEIKALSVLTKYFSDGTIESWLTNNDNDELYLIQSWKHPSGQSPIVEMQNILTPENE